MVSKKEKELKNLLYRFEMQGYKETLTPYQKGMCKMASLVLKVLDNHARSGNTMIAMIALEDQLSRMRK